MGVPMDINDNILDAIGHTPLVRLNKVVPEAEIGEILQTHGCDEAVESLIDRALDYGARDNVTAIVVHVERSG